jgi:hypothetical protein
MVRPMISRKRTGGVVAFCVSCVSVALVSGDAFARGGGFGGHGFTGRSAAFGVHSSAFRSHAQFHAHAFGFGNALRRRAGLGFFPLTGFGGAYFPGFAPPEYAVPSERPVEVEREITGAIPVPGPVREILVPLFPLRPGCPAETVTVPAANGGERTIDIMRC